MGDVKDLTRALKDRELQRVMPMIWEALNQLPEPARTRAFGELQNGEISDVVEEGDALVFYIGDIRIAGHPPDGRGLRVEAKIGAPKLRVAE